jgi:hypothetical protein
MNQPHNPTINSAPQSAFEKASSSLGKYFKILLQLEKNSEKNVKKIPLFIFFRVLGILNNLKMINIEVLN